MKLKDYINYRERGKGSKATEYNIRTQSFYDGKPIKIGPGLYPGIKAQFMNGLAIPEPAAVAHIQKRHFATLYKTKAQANTLEKLKNLNTPQAFEKANALLQSQTISLIKYFENQVNKVVEEKKKIQKLQKMPNPPKPNHVALNQAFQNFQQAYKVIKQAAPTSKVDKYFQNLDSCISQANANLAAQPSYLLDKNFQNKDNTMTDFVTKLVNLSYQIKGVSFLEHESIKFIKEQVEIPEDIEIVGSGQILVGGKQASQDALFVPKNLEIVLANGEKVNFLDYLNNNKKSATTISFSYDEWDQVLRNGAVGLQSKYSQYGNIKMSSIKLKEILELDFNYAKALRNMYILKNQVDIDKRALITHPFHVKTSGKAQKDYQMLFSISLAKFMDKIMSHNYYMVTAEYGIIDAVTYYNTLFNKHHYFKPAGQINLTEKGLNENHNVSINEKL